MDNEPIVPAEKPPVETAPKTTTSGAETSSAKNDSAPKKLVFQVNRKLVLALIVIVVLGALAFRLKALVIAATVNGSPISRLAVIQELEKRSGEQVLDSLVTKKLIQDEATRMKVNVTKADVDKEIATISDQVSKQGGTLAQALDQQGMTEADLREQIMYQKELEKIIGDKVAVTDDEANQYITDNKLTPPKGTSAEDFKNQVKEQIKQQKFGTEANKWVTDAKAKANIMYFVDYGMPAVKNVSPTPAQ